MDEDEAYYEETHGPQDGYDFIYSDEQLGGPPPISNKEMARLTMEFVSDIMRWSRTTKSARLRLDCARYLVNGWPLIWQIAHRHNVTERRVRQALREVRKHVRWDHEISTKITE
jgi:hypothetical protein